MSYRDFQDAFWCVLFRVHVFIFALYCICVSEQINDDEINDKDAHMCLVVLFRLHELFTLDASGKEGSFMQSG